MDPLTAVYSATSWINEDPEALAKAGAVLYAGEDSSFVNFDINLSDDDFDEYSLVSSVDEIVNRAERANVSMYQIQPDRTLKPVGQGIQDIPVDDTTIGKKSDGSLRLISIPDDFLDQATVGKKSGKIALKSVPENLLTGYGYAKLSSLTGYTEVPDVKRYKIRLNSGGYAYVEVPWEKGETAEAVVVDDVTIGQKPDKTIYLKSVPDEMIGNTGVVFRDWTIAQNGRIRLLASDGSWQYYTYADISAAQGDNGSLGFVRDNAVLAPFISNASLNSPEKIVAVDIADRNVVSLANGAFMGCSCLSSVNCPDVLSVGQYAFYDDDQLATADFKRAEKI